MITLALCLAPAIEQPAGSDWRPIPGQPGALTRTDTEGNVHRFFPHPPGHQPDPSRNRWRLGINAGGRGMRVLEDSAGIHTWQSVDWVDRTFANVDEFARFAGSHPLSEAPVTSYGVDPIETQRAAIQSMENKSEGRVTQAEGNGPTSPEEWERRRRRPEPDAPDAPDKSPTRNGIIAALMVVPLILAIVWLLSSPVHPPGSRPHA